MKILQITNGFPPKDRGGVENYTLEISKALRAQGHQIAVFCRESGDDQPVYSVRDGATDGIPVRFVTNRFERITPLARRYFDRKIEGLFSRWIEEQQPDVLHFQHTNGLSASLLACAAGMDIPFAVTLWDYWYICPQVNLLRPDGQLCPGGHHDVNCYECLYAARFPPPGPHVPDFSEPIPAAGPELVVHRPLGLSDAVYNPLQKLLPWPLRRALLGLYDLARLDLNLRLRLLLASLSPPDLTPLRVRARYIKETLALCQHIIAPLQFVKAQYIDFGIPREQIRVIPPGIEMAAWVGFQPAPRPRDSVLRFGYIGSLLRHKGVELMIQAFQRLRAPNTELWLHGFALPNNPFTKRLHRLAGDDPQIHFAGPYTKSQLPGILNQLDVLLIPSLWHETFSFVTREAVLAGLPVIASRMGGIPEAIDDGVNGLLLPPGDREAWTHTMRRVVEEPGLIAAFHRAQRTRRVKSMRQHATELSQLYAQMRNKAAG